MSLPEAQTHGPADMLFDQHSRYSVCAEILEQLAGGKPVRILDVGSGGECLLGQLMPAADITYIDPLLAEHPQRSEKMIGEDFFEADLAAQSFDFVVSIDFLEHIPDAVRAKFLRRSCELATVAVIVLCPCAETGEATQLDRAISDSYQHITGQAYPWLVDHHEMGLPRASDVTTVFESLDWSVKRTANGHTPWLRDFLLPILCLWDHGAQAIAHELSRFFIKEFHAYDSIPPCYREVFIASPRDLELEMTLETRKQMPEDVQQSWLRFRARIVEAGYKHLHGVQNRAILAERATTDAEQATREAEEAKTIAELSTAAAEERLVASKAAIAALDETLAHSTERSEHLQKSIDELTEELKEIKGALVHRITRAACTTYDRMTKPFKRAKKQG